MGRSNPASAILLARSTENRLSANGKARIIAASTGESNADLTI